MPTSGRASRPLAWLAAAVVLSSPAAADSPRVVASIKPLHSLVAGVMRGVGQPALIVDGLDLPYAYQLKPADKRILDQAELVFWIGPALERFLVRPMVSVSRHAETVALLDREEIKLLRDDKRRVLGKGAADPHLWLDIDNARRVVAVAAEALGEIDPANRRRYKANAKELAGRLAALDGRIAKMLKPVRGMPYIVYRNAYHYLHRRHGLSPIGTITKSLEQRPDEFRLSQMRQTIFSLGVRCVFVEPQVDTALARGIVRDTSARLAVLDPFGGRLARGPDNYFTMMEQLAAVMSGCLRRAQ